MSGHVRDETRERRALDRRGFLLGAGAAGALGLLTAQLGDPRDHAAAVARHSLEVAAAPDPRAIATAVSAMTAGGGAVFGTLVAGKPGQNVAFSPYSLVAALGMTRLGARGATARAMDAALGVSDAARLAPGLGALAATLASRAGPHRMPDGSRATIAWREANSLWGQQGVAWERRFLADLRRHDGAAMRQVDYRRDPEAARRLVNAWVEEQTAGLIRELVPRGALTALTRLTLVNAIYLKAPWASPFEPRVTRPHPFTRADGGIVRVPTMSDAMTVRHARARDWEAVSLPYVGGKLAMTLVLPRRGAERAVRSSVAGPGLGTILSALRRSEYLQVAVPRFRLRTSAGLTSALTARGMGVAFTDRADLSGMTRAERLSVDQILQQAVIAVDEHGTEAAAATAVIMKTTSAPARQVRFDRPFHAIVHDVPTRTPLFLAHVADPSKVAP